MQVSLNFFRTASVCALVYALVTIVSAWLMSQIPEPATFDETIALRDNTFNLLRSWATFLSFFFVIVAFWGVAVMKLKSSFELAILGFTFCLIFALIEMLYRSVELLAVNGGWAARYVSETDEVVRTALRVNISAFGDITFALYFVILAAFMIGSFCYSLATWKGVGLEKLVSIVFLLNTVRLLLRLMQMYGTQSWLAGLNSLIYAPIVVSLFIAIGVWLWRDKQVA